MISKCRTRYCSVFTEAFVRKCSVKKVFLVTAQNSQENTCTSVSFLKKRLWYRCFLGDFLKFLKTPFFADHLRWLLLLLDDMQNTKKMKTRESKERKFKKKINRNRVSCFNIYIVVFTFLSSTVEVGRW